MKTYSDSKTSACGEQVKEIQKDANDCPAIKSININLLNCIEQNNGCRIIHYSFAED